MQDEKTETRISLLLPKSMADDVARHAKRVPVSMNAYCRIALREKLDSDGKAA